MAACEAIFHVLSHYALQINTLEDERISYIVKALNFNIQKVILPMAMYCKSFKDVLSLLRILRKLGNNEKWRQNRRSPEPQSSSALPFQGVMVIKISLFWINYLVTLQEECLIEKVKLVPKTIILIPKRVNRDQTNLVATHTYSLLY